MRLNRTILSEAWIASGFPAGATQPVTGWSLSQSPELTDPVWIKYTSDWAKLNSDWLTKSGTSASTALGVNDAGWKTFRDTKEKAWKGSLTSVTSTSIYGKYHSNTGYLAKEKTLWLAYARIFDEGSLAAYKSFYNTANMASLGVMEAECSSATSVYDSYVERLTSL